MILYFLELFGRFDKIQFNRSKNKFKNFLDEFFTNFRTDSDLKFYDQT